MSELGLVVRHVDAAHHEVRTSSRDFCRPIIGVPFALEVAYKAKHRIWDVGNHLKDISRSFSIGVVDGRHRSPNESDAGFGSQLTTDISELSRYVAFPIHSLPRPPGKSLDSETLRSNDQGDDVKPNFEGYAEEFGRGACGCFSLHVGLLGGRHHR